MGRSIRTFLFSGPVCRVEIENLDVVICGIFPIFHGKAPRYVNAHPPTVAVRLGIVGTMFGSESDTLERIEQTAPLH